MQNQGFKELTDDLKKQALLHLVANNSQGAEAVISIGSVHYHFKDSNLLEQIYLAAQKAIEAQVLVGEEPSLEVYCAPQVYREWTGGNWEELGAIEQTLKNNTQLSPELRRDLQKRRAELLGQKTDI